MPDSSTYQVVLETVAQGTGAADTKNAIEEVKDAAKEASTSIAEAAPAADEAASSLDDVGGKKGLLDEVGAGLAKSLADSLGLSGDLAHSFEGVVGPAIAKLGPIGAAIGIGLAVKNTIDGWTDALIEETVAISRASFEAGKYADETFRLAKEARSAAEAGKSRVKVEEQLLELNQKISEAQTRGQRVDNHAEVERLEAEQFQLQTRLRLVTVSESLLASEERLTTEVARRSKDYQDQNAAILEQQELLSKAARSIEDAQASSDPIKKQELAEERLASKRQALAKELGNILGEDIGADFDPAKILEKLQQALRGGKVVAPSLIEDLSSVAGDDAATRRLRDANEQKKKAAEEEAAKAREIAAQKQAAAQIELQNAAKIAALREQGKTEEADRMEKAIHLAADIQKQVDVTGKSYEEIAPVVEAIAAAKEKEKAATAEAKAAAKEALQTEKERLADAKAASEEKGRISGLSQRHLDVDGRDITNDPVDSLGNKKPQFRGLQEIAARNAGPGVNPPSPPTDKRGAGGETGKDNKLAEAAKESGQKTSAGIAQASAAVKAAESQISAELKTLTSAINSLAGTLSGGIASASAAAKRAQQDG